MLKKAVILGSLTLSVCAVPTMAGSNYYKSGLLAGAHVGVTGGAVMFNATFDTGVPLLGRKSASDKAAKTTVMFGIVGGYRHILCKGYTLGIDISGNPLADKELRKQVNHTFGTASFLFVNRLSRRFNIIPNISFGKILWDRWHVNLGLGLAISRFRQQVHSSFPVSTNPLNFAKSSTTRLGFVPSLGMEYAITHNVSGVGNINYEIYKKISKQFGDELTLPNGGGLPGSSYRSSINPCYLTLKIGAIYRF